MGGARARSSGFVGIQSVDPVRGADAYLRQTEKPPRPPPPYSRDNELRKKYRKEKNAKREKQTISIGRFLLTLFSTEFKRKQLNGQKAATTKTKN